MPGDSLDRWWIALVVLIPLAYNPVGRWQYEPDKAALAILLTGCLAGWSLRRGLFPRSIKDGAAWCIGGYLAVRLLATGLSVAPHWSLWGDPTWGNGWWLTLAGALLFWLARGQLTTPARRRRVVTALLIGSAAVSGYGVLQYAGMDMVRVTSTLAHANLLAAYLVMVMPVTAAFLCAAPLTRPGRLGIGALLLLQAACLLFTFSRSGWLAAMAGLAVLGLAWLWLSGRRYLAAVLLLGAALGLALLLLFSLLPALSNTAPHALQTLTSLFRWRGATAQIRLLAWQAILDAIQARPWLGYGPATFRTLLEWFLPPALAPFGGADALGGRPHNLFLEIAAESGLIGLAAYLAMLTAILLPIIRSLPDGDRETRGLRVGILAALAANMVTNLFSFEIAVTAVLFWSLAGMAHGRPATAARRQSPRIGWAATAVSVVVALLMVAPGVLAFAGDSWAAEGRWDKSAKAFRLASQLSPTPEEFMLLSANVHAAWGTAAREDAIWQRGLEEHTQLVNLQPGRARYWQEQGLYLRRWHDLDTDPDLAQQAIAAYSEAIRLSPGDVDLWLDRGLTQLQANDPAGALDDIQHASALLSDYPRAYGSMSVYALAQGDTAAAATWKERALAAQQVWDDWVWRR